MFVRCIGTGSKQGNSYALINDNEILLLDLGMPEKQIKKAIDFRVSDIAGCVVTHAHKDHSLSVKNFEDMGIPVFKPCDETKACPLKIRYGSFDIQAFKLPHNGTPNYGYFIKSDGQKILYLTDFEYCSYVFKKQEVNHILVEANHSKDLLDREKANYMHSIRGHADIDTTCDFLKANKTKHLRSVILVHLSSECGDEKMFKEQAEKVVDCPVYIAKAGLEIELKENNCPF